VGRGPVGELLKAAVPGPVIAITVSRFGSYALIVTSQGVLAPLRLPQLTPESLAEQVRLFHRAIRTARSRAISPSGRTAAEVRLSDTLSWLWDAVAHPVLNRLGITGPPPDGRPWPKVWWCPSGLLSFLPLHAAGYPHARRRAKSAAVIDRAISSYTPTIRALTHSRRPYPDAEDNGSRLDDVNRMVAVAMPQTPGAPDLPSAQKEVDWLEQHFPGQVTELSGSLATHETVLAALPAGRWTHFACHAEADPANPSAGYLLLADHQKQPLTVTDIARLRLEDARLAFLSACSTARPGQRLTDEVIHLASAFQLAGYRHVIGTLWQIDDQHAQVFAEDIYSTLITTGKHDVAETVHTAVRRIRKDWAHTPSVWASHIHVGA
jgi:CHAT domain